MQQILRINQRKMTCIVVVYIASVS